MSDNDYEKFQSNLPDKTQRMIDHMVDNESRDQDFLAKPMCGNTFGDGRSKHRDCLRLEGHKGKHYCIDCGVNW